MRNKTNTKGVPPPDLKGKKIKLIYTIIRETKRYKILFITNHV